jgi:predicted Zn finger-like uncharacterized protein
MILTCPSCGTQYVVKDGAIPPGGRQVRCASCKHSWHQDPEPGSEELAEPILPASETLPVEDSTEGDALPRDTVDDEQPVDEDDESLTEATILDPRSGPEAEELAYEEAMMDEGQAAGDPRIAPGVSDLLATDDGRAQEPAADWRGPPEVEAQDDEFSPFPMTDGEVEERGRSPLLTILLVILVVAALAAAFCLFAPAEWRVRLGLAAAGASPLALVTTHMDRQRLASGQEMLNVTGRVINPTAKEQDVPPLQAQLRSKSGQLVYKWTIAPPARSLAPGASASFNSTEVSVPPGGDELTITVGGPNS